MFATISSSSRMQRSISTPGRAITNGLRISMARAIVGNRATSGSDKRPTDVRAIVTAGGRWYDQSIVASCDRSYEQSWHPVTDRTSIRGILWLSVRSIVAPGHRWYDQSWGQRLIARSQFRSFEHDDRPYYGWFCPGDHPRPMRPVVCSFYDLPTIPTFFRSRKVKVGRRPGVTGALGVLNMNATLLRLILLWRSPTTSATSRDVLGYLCVYINRQLFGFLTM